VLVKMVEGLRVFLLIGALVNFVASTVLFRAAGRPFINWYMRVFALPIALQRFLSDDRLVRIWGVSWSGLSLAAWWYLGTPEGEAFLRALSPRRPP
jgi:hypothetical protein